MQSEIVELIDLGLSELEASVYLSLLKESSITGYRIAQMINKPVPNIYKALDSLHKKGLIVADLSHNKRLYYAQPIEMYLDQIENRFQSKRKSITEKLKKISVQSDSNDGIYHIEDYEQLIGKANQIISNSQDVVVILAHQKALERVTESINDAVSRGINVFIKTDAPIELTGCTIIYEREDLYGSADPAHEWFNVIADCSEQIISFINNSNRTIYQAIWAKNTFLSTVHYSGLVHDMILNEVILRISDGATLTDIKEVIARYKTEMMENQRILGTLGYLFHLN